MQQYINIPTYYIVTTSGSYIGYHVKDKQFTLPCGTIKKLGPTESILAQKKTGTNIHNTKN